jgi:hypothetical protein
MAISTYELYKLPVCMTNTNKANTPFFLLLYVYFPMHDRQTLSSNDLYVHMCKFPYSVV